MTQKTKYPNIKLFRISKLIFGIYLGFSISNLGFITSAKAQSVGLSVSPPVVEILIAPNKQVIQTFTFNYSGDSTINVTPELHLFIPNGTSGHAQIDLSPLNPSSIPLVISSNPPLNQSYTLTPNDENLTLTLTLDAVSSDVAQDVYLALVFRTEAQDVILNDENLQPTPSISSLIVTTLNPTGVTPINLEIKDFSPPTIHDTWLPLLTSPLLENLTPIMIHPEGTYQIISPSGKVVYESKLYPNLILGNSSRSIQGSSSAGDPTPLTFSPTWSDLGPHRLSLTVTTQGGSKITQVEKVVWLLPIRFMMIIVVILILLLATFLSKRKKSKLTIDRAEGTQ